MWCRLWGLETVFRGQHVGIAGWAHNEQVADKHLDEEQGVLEVVCHHRHVPEVCCIAVGGIHLCACVFVHSMCVCLCVDQTRARGCRQGRGTQRWDEWHTV